MCLQEDEVGQQARLKAASDGEAAVKVQWGSFAWERDAPPALNHLSLEASKGQLVMVVGKVGSGKSSLLAALLGELHSRGGSLQVCPLSDLSRNKSVHCLKSLECPLRFSICQHWSICHQCTPGQLMVAVGQSGPTVVQC